VNDQRNQLSGKWKGFLAHLGPYVIVIGMLAVINLLTSDYPWVIWPALGWGVGLAFHLMAIGLDSLKNVSDKWRGLWAHLGSYLIIISFLALINLMTSDYPWFLWPALGWGAGLAIHVWVMMLGGGDREARRARRANREQADTEAPPVETVEAVEPVTNTAIQAHLEKARTYKAQIDSLIKATANQLTQARLEDLARQLDGWTAAIEELARRVDSFQQNRLIHQDLETVPQSIAKLETQLAEEDDEATRVELERTLANRHKQLAALQGLQNTMKRAEIKIESTLSALGTIYSQLLNTESTDQVAAYDRLSADVDEEVRTLQDQLEALEEVKLGRI
jgi:hypothetical protein